jgi:hypothetical protein
VADVQRPGRVGGNELHLHFLAPALARAPEACAFLQHAADHRGLGPGPQLEVDEPWAGDFRLFEKVPGDPGNERSRELAWIGLQRLGELHGDIRGVIAVIGLLGPLQHDRRVGKLRRLRLERLAQRVLDLGFRVARHGAAILNRGLTPENRGQSPISVSCASLEIGL